MKGEIVSSVARLCSFVNPSQSLTDFRTLRKSIIALESILDCESWLYERISEISSDYTRTCKPTRGLFYCSSSEHPTPVMRRSTGEYTNGYDCRKVQLDAPMPAITFIARSILVESRLISKTRGRVALNARDPYRFHRICGNTR